MARAWTREDKLQRYIDPPRNSFDQLPTPLTDGEPQVIELFDEKLHPEWEIYVQPHLNGLRPDIVLLHPRVGVAVFEVKDWNLAAMRYYDYAKSEPDRTILMARDRNGKHFSLEADNPINRILLYKSELLRRRACFRTIQGQIRRDAEMAPVLPYRRCRGFVFRRHRGGLPRVRSVLISGDV